MRRQTVSVALMIAVIVICLPAFAKEEKARYEHGDKNPREFALPAEATKTAQLSFLLGCPTDKSVIVSVLSVENLNGYIEYGTYSGQYTNKQTLLRYRLENRQQLFLTI